MGFADSKTLNHIEREEYRLQIEQSDIMGWQVDVIMPQYLSGRMLRHNKYNLNFISHDSAIALVYNTIARGFNIQQVYVDTVGDPVKYEAKLKAIFPSIQIIVAKKADSLYPIVSAASICAKTTRDRVLFEWQFPEDLKTKSWLLTHNHRVFDFPAIVLFSWSTAKTIMKTQSCAVICVRVVRHRLQRLAHLTPVCEHFE